MTPTEKAKPVTNARLLPMISAIVALAIIPINTLVWWVGINANRKAQSLGILVFTLLAAVQFFAGMTAMVSGLAARKADRGKAVATTVMGAVGVLGSLSGWILGMFGYVLGSGVGGAWGRPLRVRGRQLHPELREGSDWTRGERPDPSRLDEHTRRALEALWLHDAQKEHASVPAFSRISWMLAAVGAPAELMEWSHRAALEEIDHTRLCFALAAGYAGRSHTVEAMPDLLIGGLDISESPIAVLTTESVSDGCQLEDFNADVAAACAAVCEEPVTRAVLEQIAREERSHADFSWALLSWLLEHDRATVAPAIEQALAELERYPRPTAVGADKRRLVLRADDTLLRAHGRLPDRRWAEIWDTRLGETRARAAALLHERDDLVATG
jgi:hypothetical protein